MFNRKDSRSSASRLVAAQMVIRQRFFSKWSWAVNDGELVLFPQAIPAIAQSGLVNCWCFIEVAFVNCVIDQDGIVFDVAIGKAWCKMVDTAGLEHGLKCINVFEHACNLLFERSRGERRIVVAPPERIETTHILTGGIGLAVGTALAPEGHHQISEPGAVEGNGNLEIEILGGICRGGRNGVAGPVREPPYHASAATVNCSTVNPAIRYLCFPARIVEKHCSGHAAIAGRNGNEHAGFVRELKQGIVAILGLDEGSGFSNGAFHELAQGVPAVLPPRAVRGANRVVSREFEQLLDPFDFDAVSLATVSNLLRYDRKSSCHRYVL